MSSVWCFVGIVGPIEPHILQTSLVLRVPADDFLFHQLLRRVVASGSPHTRARHSATRHAVTGSHTSHASHATHTVAHAPCLTAIPSRSAASHWI